MTATRTGAYARFFSSGSTAWKQDVVQLPPKPKIEKVAGAITTLIIEPVVTHPAVTYLEIPSTQPAVDPWAQKMWEAYMDGVVPETPKAPLVDEQAYEMWLAYKASFDTPICGKNLSIATMPNLQ